MTGKEILKKVTTFNGCLSHGHITRWNATSRELRQIADLLDAITDEQQTNPTVEPKHVRVMHCLNQQVLEIYPDTMSIIQDWEDYGHPYRSDSN